MPQPALEERSTCLSTKNLFEQVEVTASSTRSTTYQPITNVSGRLEVVPHT
ncbi:Mannan polymerase II complex ANP1 subunit [Venturia inaequalis]|nr:Mannan polymerase II complex ANP1 subunit [Venturia inaequalis]